MPYLSFDLDALDSVPDAALAADISPAEMAYGLLRMWKRAWLEKTDMVSPARVTTFFPGDHERVARALVTCGFLAPEGQMFRVRGADRYLRLAEARAKGGRAAAGNLQKGRKKTKCPGSSRKPAELEPGSTSGSSPALSSNIEHPSSSIKKPIAAQGASEPEYVSADGSNPPGWRDLIAGLYLAFKSRRGNDPEPSPKDWAALKRLRARTKLGDAEILRRWGIGLDAEFKSRVDSFWDLEQKWDALAKGADPPKRGRATDADKDWSRPQPTTPDGKELLL